MNRRRNTPRVDGVALSQMLNSNQHFEMDNSFHLALVHVQAGPQGSGGVKRILPGHTSSKKLKTLKRCIITIPRTENQLCCARAIVMAKASVNKHPKWQSFRRGCNIQLTAAISLHHKAHVPFGACQQLVLAPLLYDYTIVFVDANRSYHCEGFGQGSQLLGILYEAGHYDAVTSLPTFFGQNHFCARCYQLYNNEGQH